MTSQDEFFNQLRATFKLEAEEYLQLISKHLLALEETLTSAAEGSRPEHGLAAQQQMIETMFRAAHSLKGAAGAADFSEIEALCQRLEQVFSVWKQQARTSPQALSFTLLTESMDSLHHMLDAVSAILADAGNPAARHTAVYPPVFRQSATPAPSPLLASGLPLKKPGKTAGVSASKATKPRVSGDDLSHTPLTQLMESVRVPVGKLEARLLEAEEMLVLNLTASQHAIELHDLAHGVETWRNEWLTVESEVRRLCQATARSPAHGERRRSAPALTRLLDFFAWSLEHLKALQNKMHVLGQTAEQNRHVVNKLVNEQLENAKRMLLLPFATISAAWPKLVRDLCREQGKRADFVIIGEEIALEKRILEGMKDPLLHLLRNCVDHGIEPAAERVKKGKPPQARITLELTRVNGNQVQFVLSDDGAGINGEKVKAAAIKLGVITVQEAENLGETEAQALIFQSSVSTSPMLTTLSGRGLGLAIVRDSAAKLGGKVSVKSQYGQGAAFSIVVPIQQTTFRGILLEAAEQVLVVPIAQVARMMQVKPGDIQTVEGSETILLDGRVVALVLLAEVLELAAGEIKAASSASVPVMVLGSGEQCVGFVIDAVLHEQEVLLKPLPPLLLRVRNITAATMLGTGQVALILNVTDLLESARKFVGRSAPLLAATKPPAEGIKTILVVDDSITSRMLLKGMLEAAGYKVQLAVDGMQGLTLLRSKKIDLVVSDVEMPRLNGFDLTARIRADKKLAEMPVVLVTALETREDRERGIDVGASAYLTKSNLDQSNLLEVVQRLI